MVMKTTDLLSSLRELGLRVTPLKQGILKILGKGNGPLSIPDIQARLKKMKLNPNKTSLYRELETLANVNVVEETQLFQDLRTYELKKKGGHHHHFICEVCKEVFDFQNEQLERTIIKIGKSLKRKGHLSKDHHLNLYGLCASCQ